MSGRRVGVGLEREVPSDLNYASAECGWLANQFLRKTA